MTSFDTIEKVRELTKYLHKENPEYSGEINKFLTDNQDHLIGDIEGGAYDDNEDDHFGLLFGALNDQFHNYLFGYDTRVGDALAWWGEDVPPNVGKFRSQ